MTYSSNSKYQTPAWRAFRWIAMIPASILAAGIIRPVFSYIYRSSIEGEPGRGKSIMFLLAELLASGMMGAALVGIAALIAPSSKRRVGMIWGGICILGLGALTVDYFTVGEKGTALSILAACIGSAYMLTQVVWGDLFKAGDDI